MQCRRAVSYKLCSFLIHAFIYTLTNSRNVLLGDELLGGEDRPSVHSRLTLVGTLITSVLRYVWRELDSYSSYNYLPSYFGDDGCRWVVID